MRNPTLALAAIALSAIAATPSARAAGPEAEAPTTTTTSGGSFHLRIEGKGGDTKVNLNLPIAIVDWALSAIEDEHVRGGRIKIESRDFSVGDLRKAWGEMKKGGLHNVLEIEDKDERLRMRTEGDRLRVEVTSRKKDGESVTINVPTAVVDALFGGSGEGLDLRAALAQIGEGTPSDLLKIEGGDSRIHVWVD